MKKCNACGSSLNDDVMNCPNCGSSNFTAEVQMQQPVQQTVQPMGQQSMSQMPVGQMPMGQQPMMQPAAVAGNMPMTYATVYMVFTAISAVTSLFSLFSDFNVSTLIGVIFSAAVAFFLFKRMKVGRILAMIESVFTSVVGGILVLLGILFAVGFTAIDLGAEFAAVGGILGGILAVFGIAMLVVGICSFIYFKKRACMYIN